MLLIKDNNKNNKANKNKLHSKFEIIITVAFTAMLLFSLYAVSVDAAPVNGKDGSCYGLSAVNGEITAKTRSNVTVSVMSGTYTAKRFTLAHWQIGDKVIVDAIYCEGLFSISRMWRAK